MTLKYVKVTFADVHYGKVFIWDKLRWIKGKAEIVDRSHNAYRLDKYEVKQFYNNEEVRIIKDIQ